MIKFAIMTDGTIGALAILILIFSTSTIVFLIKSLLDKKYLPKSRNIANATKKKEEFYVIKQSNYRPRSAKKSRYSVISSNDIFELSELDKDFDKRKRNY